MAGFAFAKHVEHVSFGQVRFGGRKTGTRTGNVVKLREVLEEAADAVRASIEEKNPGLAGRDATALQVGVAQSGQPRHGAGQRPPRAKQHLRGSHARGAGLDEQRAELEDLGVRVGLEAGGLEVDDRQRAGAGDETRERFALDPELRRAPLLEPRLRRRCRPCTRGPGGSRR